MDPVDQMFSGNTAPTHEKVDDFVRTISRLVPLRSVNKIGLKIISSQVGNHIYLTSRESQTFIDDKCSSLWIDRSKLGSI